MIDRFEIRGGAGEFEAAVVAVVLDRIVEEERAARQATPQTGLSAWVRAADQEEPDLLPLESVHPES